MAPQEAHRRRVGIQLLEDWLAAAGEARSLEELARTAIPELSDWLVEFCYQCFEERWSRGSTVVILNGLATRFGWIRGSLSAPWRVLSEWERLEPGSNHPPLPHRWLRAMVVAAHLWGWETIAALLCVGFYSLLRPSELLQLRRDDILTPDEHEGGDYLLVLIRNPKSRWRGVTRQYARLDFRPVLPFLLNFLATLRPSQLLWPASPATFGTRWRALCTRVLGHDRIVTPASLRTGGATFLFALWDEDLPRLQWRGRWRDSRMLSIYVQELQAARIQMRLAPDAAPLIDALNLAWPDVMGTEEAEQR